jgi:hypothetical protein
MDLEECSSGHVKWAEVSQDGIQTLVFVFMFMNVWVVWKGTTESTSNLHSGGARFEFRPEHRPS